MSASEPPPILGVPLVAQLLPTTDVRTAAFDARLAELAHRPLTATDRTRVRRDARVLRDDIRQARASLAVVQTYLREQATLLHMQSRTERKPY